MTPADQAFDCVAAEIALDVTADLKDLRLHRNRISSSPDLVIRKRGVRVCRPCKTLITKNATIASLQELV
jgi:hypothetical protein